MVTSWHIVGARLVDPALGTDRIGDLQITEGVITDEGTKLPRSACRLDASGMVLVPGLVDMHVHFREPGDEEAETIFSGSRAAAHGGFTTVVAMPNTSPPVDTPKMVEFVLKKGREAGLVHILCAACATRNRAGLEPADIERLAEAGASAFTDDGNNLASEEILAAVMRRARRCGRPVLDHALDPQLARDGVMREGPHAAKLGLPGIPAEAESTAVRRDAKASYHTGCPVHIQHLSTAAGLQQLKEARQQGILISAEATPHHIALCDEDVDGHDTNLKMNPPLGSRADREAITEAVVNGTIEAFATDHAPHHVTAKGPDFLRGAFGVVGLETAVGVTFSVMVKTGRMSFMEWLRRWTTGPARIMGLPPPSLQSGSAADIVLLDLERTWVVRKENFFSKSGNSPFLGWRLTGKVMATFVRGRMIWADKLLTSRIRSANS